MSGAERDCNGVAARAQLRLHRLENLELIDLQDPLLLGHGDGDLDALLVLALLSSTTAATTRTMINTVLLPELGLSSA
jgi:hypothetical protein